jgi:hypothetical protein
MACSWWMVVWALRDGNMFLTWRLFCLQQNAICGCSPCVAALYPAFTRAGGDR